MSLSRFDRLRRTFPALDRSGEEGIRRSLHRRYGISFLCALVCGCALSYAWPAAATQSATVPKKMSLPHAISPHFFGVNIDNSYWNPVPLWTDPKLQRAIKAVGIQAVRFPGGDQANYWDWQSGTVYPLGNANQTQDTLSAFSSLVRATGSYPVYALNVMTLDNALLHYANLSRGIANQLRMLEAAHDLNLPVQDFELGNEFFWSSPDYYVQAFPTAADYASEMSAWAVSLKQEYPNARIASVGSIPYSGDARTASWNAAVIGKIHDVDAVTLHRYDSLIDGGVWNGTSPDAVLGNVFTDWSTIVSGEVNPIEKAGMLVWVTEFGGLKDCTSNAQFTGTWLEAIYQAQMVVQFLSTSSVDQIELYNFTGSTSSLIFQNASTYWDACLSTNITFNATYGDLTATGQAYALFGSALKEAKSVYPVAFPELPMVHPTSGAPYPSVTGVALTGQLNQWMLINLSAEPLTLQYPGMGQGSIESLSAPSLMTMVTSEHVLTHTTRLFDGRSFVLAPFSVNRIVVRPAVKAIP